MSSIERKRKVSNLDYFKCHPAARLDSVLRKFHVGDEKRGQTGIHFDLKLEGSLPWRDWARLFANDLTSSNHQARTLMAS